MTRRFYARLTGAAIGTIIAIAVLPMPKVLMWNASASVPVGFYAIGSAARFERGDLAVALPPEALADYLVARGYIGRGVPLIKPVAALPGQSVCRVGLRILIDGKLIGEALQHDRQGRDLPVWEGCRRIGADQLFLMNPSVRDSLDGRYFGPLPRASVTGKATPLYTDERGDGRFIWRSAAR